MTSFAARLLQYLPAAFKRDHQRAIDGYIDYFGGVVPRRTPSRPPDGSRPSMRGPALTAAAIRTDAGLRRGSRN